jgi:hypothetical protein
MTLYSQTSVFIQFPLLLMLFTSLFLINACLHTGEKFAYIQLTSVSDYPDQKNLVSTVISEHY